MNVTLRRALMVCVLALILAAMMVAMAMPAFAAPQSSIGTCGIGGPSGNGASGCAGNVGGSIVTEQQGCKDIGGPFEDKKIEGQISCPGR